MSKKKDKKDHHKSSRSKHHKKDRENESRHSHKKRSKDKHRDSEGKEHDKTHDKHQSNVVQIGEDDYFLKNEEFRVWLHIKKSITFESLTTVQARDLFTGDFCKDWNRGRLASMFYDGAIPTELRQQCAKTAHKWGIKLSADEKEHATDLAYRVDASTRKQFSGAWNHMAKEKDVSASPNIQPFSSSNGDSRSSKSSKRSPEKIVAGKRSRDYGEEQAQREEQRKEEKSELKRQRYYAREKANVIMDEVAPKATGRDAQLDKKREAGSKIQGTAADKEAGADGMEMAESVTMGGGDDFASVKARMQKGKQRKMAQKEERIRELQDKERDKNQNFMNQLGIDFSKGPIKIQPR